MLFNEKSSINLTKKSNHLNAKGFARLGEKINCL